MSVDKTKSNASSSNQSSDTSSSPCSVGGGLHVRGGATGGAAGPVLDLSCFSPSGRYLTYLWGAQTTATFSNTTFPYYLSGVLKDFSSFLMEMNLAPQVGVGLRFSDHLAGFFTMKPGLLLSVGKFSDRGANPSVDQGYGLAKTFSLEAALSSVASIRGVLATLSLGAKLLAPTNFSPLNDQRPTAPMGVTLGGDRLFNIGYFASLVVSHGTLPKRSAGEAVLAPKSPPVAPGDETPPLEPPAPPTPPPPPVTPVVPPTAPEVQPPVTPPELDPPSLDGVERKLKELRESIDYMVSICNYVTGVTQQKPEDYPKDIERTKKKFANFKKEITKFSADINVDISRYTEQAKKYPTSESWGKFVGRLIQLAGEVESEHARFESHRKLIEKCVQTKTPQTVPPQNPGSSLPPEPPVAPEAPEAGLGGGDSPPALPPPPRLDKCVPGNTAKPGDTNICPEGPPVSVAQPPAASPPPRQSKGASDCPKVSPPLRAAMSDTAMTGLTRERENEMWMHTYENGKALVLMAIEDPQEGALAQMRNEFHIQDRYAADGQAVSEEKQREGFEKWRTKLDEDILQARRRYGSDLIATARIRTALKKTGASDTDINMILRPKPHTVGGIDQVGQLYAYGQAMADENIAYDRFYKNLQDQLEVYKYTAQQLHKENYKGSEADPSQGRDQALQLLDKLGTEVAENAVKLFVFKGCETLIPFPGMKGWPPTQESETATATTKAFVEGFEKWQKKQTWKQRGKQVGLFGATIGMGYLTGPASRPLVAGGAKAIGTVARLLYGGYELNEAMQRRMQDQALYPVGLTKSRPTSEGTLIAQWFVDQAFGKISGGLTGMGASLADLVVLNGVQALLKEAVNVDSPAWKNPGTVGYLASVAFESMKQSAIDQILGKAKGVVIRKVNILIERRLNAKVKNEVMIGVEVDETKNGVTERKIKEVRGELVAIDENQNPPVAKVKLPNGKVIDVPYNASDVQAIVKKSAPAEPAPTNPPKPPLAQPLPKDKAAKGMTHDPEPVKPSEADPKASDKRGAAALPVYFRPLTRQPNGDYEEGNKAYRLIGYENRDGKRVAILRDENGRDIAHGGAIAAEIAGHSFILSPRDRTLYQERFAALTQKEQQEVRAKIAELEKISPQHAEMLKGVVANGYGIQTIQGMYNIAKKHPTGEKLVQAFTPEQHRSSCTEGACVIYSARGVIASSDPVERFALARSTPEAIRLQQIARKEEERYTRRVRNPDGSTRPIVPEDLRTARAKPGERRYENVAIPDQSQTAPNGQVLHRYLMTNLDPKSLSDTVSRVLAHGQAVSFGTSQGVYYTLIPGGKDQVLIRDQHGNRTVVPRETAQKLFSQQGTFRNRLGQEERILDVLAPEKEPFVSGAGMVYRNSPTLRSEVTRRRGQQEAVVNLYDVANRRVSPATPNKIAGESDQEAQIRMLSELRKAQDAQIKRMQEVMLPNLVELLRTGYRPKLGITSPGGEGVHQIALGKVEYDPDHPLRSRVWVIDSEARSPKSGNESREGGYWIKATTLATLYRGKPSLIAYVVDEGRVRLKGKTVSLQEALLGAPQIPQNDGTKGSRAAPPMSAAGGLPRSQPSTPPSNSPAFTQQLFAPVMRALPNMPRQEGKWKLAYVSEPFDSGKFKESYEKIVDQINQTPAGVGPPKPTDLVALSVGYQNGRRLFALDTREHLLHGLMGIHVERNRAANQVDYQVSETSAGKEVSLNYISVTSSAQGQRVGSALFDRFVDHVSDTHPGAKFKTLAASSKTISMVAKTIERPRALLVPDDNRVSHSFDSLPSPEFLKTCRETGLIDPEKGRQLIGRVEKLDYTDRRNIYNDFVRALQEGHAKARAEGRTKTETEIQFLAEMMKNPENNKRFGTRPLDLWIEGTIPGGSPAQSTPPSPPTGRGALPNFSPARGWNENPPGGGNRNGPPQVGEAVHIVPAGVSPPEARRAGTFQPGARDTGLPAPNAESVGDVTVITQPDGYRMVQVPNGSRSRVMIQTVNRFGVRETVNVERSNTDNARELQLKPGEELYVTDLNGREIRLDPPRPGVPTSIPVEIKKGKPGEAPIYQHPPLPTGPRPPALTPSPKPPEANSPSQKRPDLVINRKTFNESGEVGLKDLNDGSVVHYIHGGDTGYKKLEVRERQDGQVTVNAQNGFTGKVEIRDKNGKILRTLDPTDRMNASHNLQAGQALWLNGNEIVRLPNLLEPK